jgi:SpoVK/Ycf46/Vps4 family AAA+-type ATPase
MRPGRFDYLIYVGPPDENARKQILEITLKSNLRYIDRQYKLRISRVCKWNYSSKNSELHRS